MIYFNTTENVKLIELHFQYELFLKALQQVLNIILSLLSFLSRIKFLTMLLQFAIFYLQRKKKTHVTFFSISQSIYSVTIFQLYIIGYLTEDEEKK
jgi:hypothetical protein